MSQEGAVSCMDPRNWIPCNYYNRLVRFFRDFGSRVSVLGCSYIVGVLVFIDVIML